jgi:hypothetical protein
MVRLSCLFAYYSHSMVPGGLEVMSKTTRLILSTSLVMRLDIFPNRSWGSLAQSAVMASLLVTARMAMQLAKVLLSPITPTLLIGKRTAKDCQSFLYRPAVRISSKRIESAFRRIVSLSSVISPMILMASPGPGNGCLHIKSSLIPRDNPSLRTSSLKRSCKGSGSFFREVRPHYDGIL